MIYQYEHIDHPMSLLDLRLRQGGRYAHYIFDMDYSCSTVFPLFIAPGAEIFSRLMIGWILCTTRRTVTGILPFADPWAKRAHDAYHRFLPDARWCMAELWKLLAKILIQAFGRNGIITLALYDTLFHRSGRKVNWAGWWRDAVRSTHKNTVYAWGLNLVVLTLQIQPPWGGEPLDLPINMRVH